MKPLWPAVDEFDPLLLKDPEFEPLDEPEYELCEEDLEHAEKKQAEQAISATSRAKRSTGNPPWAGKNASGTDAE